MDLFQAADPRPARLELADRALLLPRLALPLVATLEPVLAAITRAAPFRHLQTPRGFPMSVATTNCGAMGWTSDRRGYRYRAEDPLSGRPWPAMPPAWHALAVEAAAIAGFDGFDPDCCLVNRYDPGARMGLHQDRDEADFAQPVVSISFGLPATFLFGGMERTSRTQRVPLVEGDVVVWGGPTRLAYHGIAPLKAGATAHRVNLTFRRATPSVAALDAQAGIG